MPKNWSKILLWVAVFSYFIWPFDFVPGLLVDDALVAMLGIILTKKINRS